ncbi:MAG: Flp family type IVb pilin [Acidobacteria bacterium]|nr:MAG: Flp family type IVb pilin [Acidobacteriota bacterium]
MKTLLRRLIWEEQGQDLIEYALLAAFVALAATGMLILIGPQITTLYTSIHTQLTNAVTAASAS